MILKVRHLVTGGASKPMESIESPDLRPPKGAKHSKKRVGRGQGSGQGDRRAAATRARSRVRASSTSAGSKAARCRCTAACRSAGSTTPFREEYEVVNLDTLAERFDAGHRGDARSCCASAAWSAARQRVKVLARGEITKALTMRAHKFSGKAAEKIAAGRRHGAKVAGSQSHARRA